MTPRPPSALEHLDDILDHLGRGPGIFTDYDGTLTPIVDDPAQALLDPEVRDTLRALAAVVPVAVVSGRDLADVEGLVGIEGMVCAGSHGFDISGPGLRLQHPAAVALLPDLEQAEAALRAELDELGGVTVERKRFAVAVHTRRASEPERARAREVAARVAGGLPGLEIQDGKEIRELRPAVDWDKGKAISYLVDAFGTVTVPLYLGDDTTDEDAFRHLAAHGGIGVRVDDDPGETAATYVLHDTGEAAEFLARLATHLRAPDSEP